MYDHDYVMNFHLMVMLRSTVSPYERLVIEVAYGEMIAPKELLGVGMMHRPCLTYPGQHQCGLNVYYFLFSKYKNLCIYILISKSICSIK